MPVDEQIRTLERQIAAGNSQARRRFQARLLQLGQSPALAWKALPIDLDPQIEAWLLTGEVQGNDAISESVTELLTSLDVDRIVQHFPREETGALRSNTQVLLTRLSADSLFMRRREDWLIARSPRRKRDARRLLITVDNIIGLNNQHNWDTTPWLWNYQHPLTRDKLWGLHCYPDYELEHCSANLDRIDDCIQLQQQGKGLEALEYCGIEWCPMIERVFNGEEIGPAVSGRPGRQRTWSELTREAILTGALWRWPGLLACEAEKIRRWALLKRGRKQRPPTLRLFSFPRQMRIRKITLMLTLGRRARIELVETGSQQKFPEVIWRRPDFSFSHCEGADYNWH